MHALDNYYSDAFLQKVPLEFRTPTILWETRNPDSWKRYRLNAVDRMAILSNKGHSVSVSCTHPPARRWRWRESDVRETFVCAACEFFGVWNFVSFSLIVWLYAPWAQWRRGAQRPHHYYCCPFSHLNLRPGQKLNVV